MINVTKPYLPPLEEFIPYLKEIWKTGILTNSGPLSQELERNLSCKFELPNLSLVNNATSGLLIALKALKLGGDIITTPFTFAATAQSIIWNNCRPKFVDIDPVTFNIDSKEVKKAIDDKVVAIMGVHCYGYPCELDELDAIARSYGLALIYDAAHAFGVNVDKKSLLSYGDVSVVSFHATKVLNTFEGGMIVASTSAIKDKINLNRNFGIENEDTITDIGINAKISEIHAAMGLLQLKYFDHMISKRKEIFDLYMSLLSKVIGLRLPYHIHMQKGSNFSYFPLVIEDNFPLNRDDFVGILRSKGINPRKYFSPLLSDFRIFGGRAEEIARLPNARKVAKSIVCLPIYPDLSHEDVHRICNYILEMQ